MAVSGADSSFTGEVSSRLEFFISVDISSWDVFPCLSCVKEREEEDADTEAEVDSWQTAPPSFTVSSSFVVVVETVGGIVLPLIFVVVVVVIVVGVLPIDSKHSASKEKGPFCAAMAFNDRPVSKRICSNASLYGQ